MNTITAKEAARVTENQKKKMIDLRDPRLEIFMKEIQEAAACGKNEINYHFKMIPVALYAKRILPELGYSCHINWIDNIVRVSW